jgi:hypothetical protein
MGAASDNVTSVNEGVSLANFFLQFSFFQKDFPAFPLFRGELYLYFQDSFHAGD